MVRGQNNYPLIYVK